MSRAEHKTRLSAWLTTATQDLCVPAAERIAEEIRDYYQSAMDDAREHGATEAEAEDRAMALLGSARHARRRFRREHLTPVEARKVWRYSDPRFPGDFGRRKLAPFLYGVLTVMTYFFVMLVLISADLWLAAFSSSLFASAVAIAVVLVVPSSRLDAKLGGTPSLVLNMAIAWLFWSMLILQTAFSAARGILEDDAVITGVMTLTGMVLGWGGVTAGYISLARKLMRDKNGLYFLDAEEVEKRQYLGYRSAADRERRGPR